MDKFLPLSDGERGYLQGMRALTIDVHGRECFVGLTFDESIWYVTDTKRRRGDVSPEEEDQADARFDELSDRHDAARMGILVAENEMRVDKPTIN